MPARQTVKQTVQMRIAHNDDQNDLQVRLKPIRFRRLKKHAVLGMQLTDVTPEFKNPPLDDVYFDGQAVILDPGNDSDRLNIGRLAEGYCFWKVGHKAASVAFASSSARFSPRPSVKTPQRTRFTESVSFTDSARSMATET